MAHAELERVRLLGMAAVVVNVMSAFLVRTLDASLRAYTDGSFRGEAFWLAVLLVATSLIGSVTVSVVLGSCFWTHLRGEDSNPFVGDDYLPAWADLALIVALLVTGTIVVRQAL